MMEIALLKAQWLSYYIFAWVYSWILTRKSAHDYILPHNYKKYSIDLYKISYRSEEFKSVKLVLWWPFMTSKLSIWEILLYERHFDLNYSYFWNFRNLIFCGHFSLIFDLKWPSVILNIFFRKLTSKRTFP